MGKHLGTSPPSKLHLDIGYVPPTDTGSLCLAVDSTRTAVPGPFPVAGPTVCNSARWTRRSGVWCRQLQTVF